MKRFMLMFAFVCLFLAPIGALDVEFQRISDRLLVFRSYDMYEGYLAAANGLIVINDRSVLIVDAAWRDRDMRQVMAYIETTIRKPVAACIVTHSHRDRTGGLDVVKDRGISIYMSKITQALLLKEGRSYPYKELRDEVLRFDGLEVRICFFGATHAPDTLALWIPSHKLLFGGCMVKSLESRSLGSILGANIPSWLTAMEMMLKTYADCVYIIPGHGAHGGVELLRHTLALLKRVGA